VETFSVQFHNGACRAACTKVCAAGEILGSVDTYGHGDQGPEHNQQKALIERSRGLL